jgi:Flp pilus assembly pilin Flp
LRGTREYLAALLGRAGGDGQLLEYLVILVLIAIVVVLAFVFLGDAIADLITAIGGRVDQQTVPQ